MKTTRLIILFYYCIIPHQGFAKVHDEANQYETYTNAKWKLSKTQKKYLKNGKVLADAEVETIENMQTFRLQVFAYHDKKCRKVIRKMSMFESYKEWINFINHSTYDPKTHLLTLKANHPLLPYPMIIYIITERPTKPGRYPFSFPTGLFGGLKGYFEITEFNNRCLFYAHSNWLGKKTKIPDFVVELFSETLSKLGGEMLMRKIR